MFPMVILAIADDGDREFMMQLYIDYHNIMRKEAHVILDRTEPIEDIIQDVCVKLIEKISLLRTLPCCTLYSYVVFTVRSVTINFIKRSDVAKKHIYFGADGDVRDSIIDIVPDEGESPEDTAIVGDSVRLLHDAISRLPDRDRQILEFKYFLSVSDKEIAEAFGIKPSSVREYLTRARRKALKLLKDEGITSAN